MHRNVEALIGRLATDARLQRRFNERPLEVLRESALELTEVELEALAALPADALRDFSARLDPRIRKAEPAPTDRPGAGNPDPGPRTRNDQETQR